MVGSLVDEIAEPIVEAKEQVRGPSTAAAEGQSFLLPASGLPIPPSVSDDKVAGGITIWEIGPRVFAIEGQVQVMVSQMVQPEDDLEQVGAQVEQGLQTAAQRDETMVSEMSSWESTLMHCIPGMDRGLANLERRPPGPQ
nr:hypothetical protein [Tanacetum cinerariifolium]